MMRRTLICVLFALAFALSAARLANAQQTIFIARHAERADAGSPTPPPAGADPDLSDIGRARAASLAGVLKDAGITAIFATEFKRTQQTAAPAAKALGLPVITVKSGDTASLLAQLKAAQGNALVIGHSNTIPPIVKALGLATPPAIADDEFDKLFLVTPAGEPKGPPTLLTLHYR
jgi:phosphohistidine phosphatase SixA